MPATLEQIAQAQTNFLAELREDLENVVSAANRVYAYTHSAVVTDDLESDYQSIIEDNPELENASAVGMLALLKDGETVPVQGARLFINDAGEQSDYTFSGTNSQGGTELVKVWYFESGGALTLVRPSADIIAVSVKTASVIPSLSPDFFDYANEVSANASLPCKPKGVRKQSFTCGGEPDYAHISDEVCEFESSAAEIKQSGRNAFYGARFTLKKASFPNLTDLSQRDVGDYGLFDGCTLLEDIYFPNILTIGSKNQAARALFNQVKRVVIPDTEITIGSYICNNNQIIELNCKDAVSINDNWCGSTPTQSFVMCSDWGATVNIAVAAANWTMQQFIGFMTTGLRDMTPAQETRTLKIPSAMLANLQANTSGAAAITAANAMGWTITS